MPTRPPGPALATLLALLAAAPLVAQPPGTTAPPSGTGPRRAPSDSVPRELVQALLPDSDGLRVGEAAGDLPADVLPADGIVLGSAEFGTYSTTLVVVMRPEHEAIAAHEARARAAGWAPPTVATLGSRWEPMRGFLPSASAAAMGMPMGSAGVYGMGRGTTRLTTSVPLCRGDAMLVAATAPWSGGRTLLRLQSMAAAPSSPCRSRASDVVDRQLVRSVTVYDSIIPGLQAPARAQVRPAGWGGGGSGEWEMQATIESAATPAELLAHYAAEMAREGWTSLGEGATAAAAAVQQWRKTGDDGRRWHATITLAGRPEPRQYRASLRLEREGER